MSGCGPKYLSVYCVFTNVRCDEFIIHIKSNTKCLKQFITVNSSVTVQD